MSFSKQLLIQGEVGMTEGIYILTMLYAIYVIDDVEGIRFVAFIRDTLQIDLVQLHQKYRHYRDSITKVIASTLPVNLSPAT